jgi:hypothetical protein
MKTTAKGFIISAVLLCVAFVWAGETQHIAPGEVPEGITADDWGIVQEAYLKASNTDEGDAFGESVAVSGDTIVVGTLDEASNATGVNGDQSDNSADHAGAAYVFIRNGATWSQQAYLKASNTETSDLFGNSVSLSGNTVVVGARWEDSNASGVNGNQSDNSASNSGAAYVFTGFFAGGSAVFTDCYPVPTGFMLEWITVSGVDSVVKYTPDLTIPFTPLSAALPYPANSYIDTVYGTNSKCFYRVDLEP